MRPSALPGRRTGGILFSLAVAATAAAVPLAPASAAPGDVFVSEIHYDNAGTDTGEAIEVTAPAGTDLSGWSVVLYNGANGASYDTAALSGTVDDQSGGLGTTVLDYPANGIQNGAPDSVALVDASGTVVEHLSWEGTLTATDGPAAGTDSTDIGVEETGSTPVGQSLQKVDGAWTGPAESSFGAVNGAGGSGDGGSGDGDPGEGDPGDGDPGDGTPADLRLTELHYDNDGGDTGEAVEVSGPASTDLSGWTVALYNGNSGTTYGTVPLSGTIDDETDGRGAVSFDHDGIQNGAPDGLALVAPDGTVVEFLSYEGTLEATDGPAAGTTSTDIGVEETGTTPAGQSLQKIDGAWTGPATSSFGSLNGAGGGDPDPGPATEVAIHDVQGGGDASPLAGQDVIVEGVVVGAPTAGSPAGTFNGFYVQEEDADADSDDATSEGVFVFTDSAAPAVALGDTVRVTATVAEFSGLTELTQPTTEVLASGSDLPTPATVELPLADLGDLETVEGMLATFPQELTLSEYFNYDRFGEVVAALPTFADQGQVRPMTPTAVYDPDDPRAAALADTNLRSRITIDDGLSTQNPDAPVHPVNRELFSPGNDFRGGEQVGGLTGPVHFAFGVYRVLPLPDGAGYDTYSQLEAPAEPEDVGGDVRVAGMNALNYFVTLDDGGNACGPQNTLECRGADDEEELQRQRTKLLNAITASEADVVGLNEVENSGGVEVLEDIVAGLNDREGPGTWDYVHAGDDGVVGTDAIKVGLVYRTAAVKPVGTTAVLDDPSFTDPLGTGQDKNRAAIGQSFAERGTDRAFSLALNHLKSKGSSCGAGDDDPVAGNCDATRTAAAERLADWIDTDPTGVKDKDWLILGDLNSYDHEDPISTLASRGYADQVKRFNGELAYSYVFDGQFGYLDHLLASKELARQVTGTTEWHINADTPDIVDYETTFKGPYADSLFDPTTPYRASDHDVAIIGLDLRGKPYKDKDKDGHGHGHGKDHGHGHGKGHGKGHGTPKPGRGRH